MSLSSGGLERTKGSLKFHCELGRHEQGAPPDQVQEGAGGRKSPYLSQYGHSCDGHSVTVLMAKGGMQFATGGHNVTVPRTIQP